MPEALTPYVDALESQCQNKDLKARLSSCLLAHCEAVAALHGMHHTEQAMYTWDTATRAEEDSHNGVAPPPASHKTPA